jgi:hypothetical protein
MLSPSTMSAPKAHRNLAIRGGVASCQGFLSLILVAYEVDIPHTLPTAICQFWAATTLLVQWRTANPWMFLLRACANFTRSFLVIHAAACGRKWIGEDCITSAWSDVRLPFRVLHCLAAIRLFLLGLSLTLQFLFPLRGVGVRGNEQLFYRGCACWSGVLLHFSRAMLKLGELTGTPWERIPVEIGINFIRGFILIPISGWSLLNQWVVTGSGRRTDDIRTSLKGEIHHGAADTMADYLEPHQGHRNLLIRGVMALCQTILSLWLVAYSIDVPHKLPLACCQLVSSAALFVQWRTDRSSMFVVRACASFMRVVLLGHLAACGRVWPWQDCVDGAWSDVRRPFRLLHCLAAVRMLLNGLSLCLQWAFPERGITLHYGHEQLFFRGCIRGAGVPLYLARAVTKMSDLAGTEHERAAVEIAINFIRALLLIPIQSWSLLHQWRYTGKAADATGQYGDKCPESVHNKEPEVGELEKATNTRVEGSLSASEQSQQDAKFVL